MSEAPVVSPGSNLREAENGIILGYSLGEMSTARRGCWSLAIIRKDIFASTQM